MQDGGEYMKTVSIINQKGGVSKTTIAVNLAGGINKLYPKLRLLFIDTDPQGNSTDVLFGDMEEDLPTIERLFSTSFYKGIDIIHKTRFEKLDIIPSNIALSAKEFHASTILKGHERIAIYLQQIKDTYDLCIIDCPPSLGLFSLNALMASDYFLIPVVPEKFAIKGIKDLLQTCEVVREVNANLKPLGILPAIVDRRYSLHKDLMEELKEMFDSLALNDLSIKTNAPLKEAANLGKTIFEYDNKAATYKQFLTLSKWLVERIGLNER